METENSSCILCTLWTLYDLTNQVATLPCILISYVFKSQGSVVSKPFLSSVANPNSNRKYKEEPFTSLLTCKCFS